MSPVETIGQLPPAAGRSARRQNKSVRSAIEEADMTDNTLDRADVIIFPPVIPLFDAGDRLRPAMAGAAWMDRAISIAAGGSNRACSSSSRGWSRWRPVTRVGRHGTNVNPSRPSTALVTDGVFGHTRNPLYVGISVALCGRRADLRSRLDGAADPAKLRPAAFRRGRGARSVYLEQKFGDAYRHYKARVPRYFAGN